LRQPPLARYPNPLIRGLNSVSAVSRTEPTLLLLRAGKTEALSQRALVLLRGGKTEDALPILDDLATATRRENTLEARALATELEGEIARIRAAPAEAALEDLERAAAKLAPLLDDPPQFKLLHKIAPKLSRVSLVEVTVKRFSKEFKAGARNPELFLSEVRLRQPELLFQWLAAPQEKRIFVIGAEEDSAKVSELAESLKPDGYVVFFYDFCRENSLELCSSQAVGAMCSTSGNTVVYDSPFAASSKYVQVEVATAQFLQGAGPRVILISSSELVGAVAGAQFAMYVAETPSQP
jgi:hypothetical protein